MKEKLKRNVKFFDVREGIMWKYAFGLMMTEEFE